MIVRKVEVMDLEKVMDFTEKINDLICKEKPKVVNSICSMYLAIYFMQRLYKVPDKEIINCSIIMKKIINETWSDFKKDFKLL